MYQENESPTLVKTEIQRTEDQPPVKRKVKRKPKAKAKSPSLFGTNVRTNLVSRYRFWKNLHKISGDMVESFESLGKELNRK